MAERKRLLARLTHDGIRFVSATALTLGTTACAALHKEKGEDGVAKHYSGVANEAEEGDSLSTVYAVALVDLNRNGKADSSDLILDRIMFEPNGDISRNGVAVIELTDGQVQNEITVADGHRAFQLPGENMFIFDGCEASEVSSRAFLACLFNEISLKNPFAEADVG